MIEGKDTKCRTSKITSAVGSSGNVQSRSSLAREEKKYQDINRRRDRFTENLGGLLSEQNGVNLLDVTRKRRKEKIHASALKAVQEINAVLNHELSHDKEKEILEIVCNMLEDELKPVDTTIVQQVNSVRLDDLGMPMHPLEAELLDIADEQTDLITREGVLRPVERYRDRVNRKENPHDFVERIYHDHIEAGVIYQDYLRKIDPNLVTSLRTYCYNNDLDSSEIIPPKSVRINKIAKRINDMSGFSPARLQSILHRKHVRTVE